MFLFGKKREEQSLQYEKSSAGDSLSAFKAAEGFVTEHKTGITILGTNAPVCTAFKETVDEVIAQLYPGECAEYIDDVHIIAAYGVIHTPALVIDGKLVCTGRVPPKNEIVAFLKKIRARRS